MQQLIPALAIIMHYPIFHIIYFHSESHNNLVKNNMMEEYNVTTNRCRQTKAG